MNNIPILSGYHCRYRKPGELGVYQGFYVKLKHSEFGHYCLTCAQIVAAAHRWLYPDVGIHTDKQTTWPFCRRCSARLPETSSDVVVIRGSIINEQ